MANERVICDKCGKEKPIKDFFKYKDGTCCELCKVCLTTHVDNTDPSTFLWILEKFDVPFIEPVWTKKCNDQIKKHGKLGPASILGLYLRDMQMKQYKDYSYKDTDALKYAADKKHADEAARRQEKAQNAAYIQELTERYERGEISKAEFDTLNPENFTETDIPAKLEGINPITIDESDIVDKLSQDELQYLAVKWGSNYRPSEWVRMEEIYSRYENEYELNTDRELTLRLICKTQLKMDQALDTDNMNDVKSLSGTLDTLRKSAKFTEAQNKEEQNTRYLDSIGELVAFCEREGGIIDQLPDPDEYPQDKIDITIKDLQSYTYNLAVRELGLGDLIESYIKKLEEAEKDDTVDPLQGLVTNEEEASEDELTDEEAYDFQNYLENEIEQDAEELLKSVGDLNGS